MCSKAQVPAGSAHTVTASTHLAASEAVAAFTSSSPGAYMPLAADANAVLYSSILVVSSGSTTVWYTGRLSTPTAAISHPKRVQEISTCKELFDTKTTANEGEERNQAWEWQQLRSLAHDIRSRNMTGQTHKRRAYQATRRIVMTARKV